MKHYSLFYVLLATLFVTACGSPVDAPLETDAVDPPAFSVHKGSALPDDEIIAEWDGGRIYVSYLDDIVQPERSLAAIRLEDDVDEMTYVASKRREVLKTLLDNYLLITEAESRGLTISETEREELLHQARSQFDSEEEYLRNLAASGQTEEQLVDFLTTLALGRKCLTDKQMEIWESITLEIKNAYYFENIDLFTPPARYFVNWVVIYITDERPEDEAKAEAERLHAEVSELIAGVTDFTARRTVVQDYAKEYSEHPSGDYNYGYVIIDDVPARREEYSPEFIDALEEIEEGGLSPVVRIKDGFTFFLTKEKSPSFVQPFEAEAVQKILPHMILKDEMDSWFESLREKHNLEIYEERFYSVPYKKSTGEEPLSDDDADAQPAAQPE